MTISVHVNMSTFESLVVRTCSGLDSTRKLLAVSWLRTLQLNNASARKAMRRTNWHPLKKRENGSYYHILFGWMRGW